MTFLIAAGVVLGVILSAITLVKYVIPACRAVARFFRKMSLFFDLFNGRDAMVDEATGEQLPEVLPLPKALAEIRKTQAAQAAMQAQQGEAISDLTSVVGQVADQHATLVAHSAQLATHDTKIGEHDSVIAALIAGTYALGSKDALSAAEKSQPGPVVSGEAEK